MTRTVGFGIITFVIIVEASSGQSWSMRPPLPSVRERVTAVTPPDGHAFVAGGTVQTQPVLATMHHRAVANMASWTPRQSLPAAISSNTLTVGIDGYVYFVGGIVGNVATNTCFRYNPKSNVWSPMPPLQTPRAYAMAAVGPDGDLYVIGGYQSPTATSLLNTVEVFRNGTWQAGPALSVPRSGGQAVTGIDGRVYVFGGDSSNTVEILGCNPTCAWTLGVPIPNARRDFSVVSAPDGLMYFTGGTPPTFTGSNGVDVVNTSGSWSVAPPMSEPRATHGSTVAEGFVYVIGGYTKATGVKKSVEGFRPLKAAIPLASMTAWWRFEETGSTITDSAGNSHGSKNGGARPFSRVGKGLQLNGNFYVTIPSNQTLEVSAATDLSIEAWVAPGDIASARPIVSKRSGNRGYVLFIDPAGNARLRLSDGSTTQEYTSAIPASTNGVIAATWSHVVVSLNRSSTPARGVFYINGVRAGTFSPLTGSLSTGAPLLIGRDMITGWRYRGHVDEVTLYKKPLSWAEVRAIFLAGSQGKQ